MARKKHKPEEINTHLRTVEIERAKGISLELARKRSAFRFKPLFDGKKSILASMSNNSKGSKSSRLKILGSSELLQIRFLISQS